MVSADAPLHVFVVGCSRGGTTLTQRLVAERMGLFTLPETRFFGKLVGNLEQRRFPETQRRRPFLRHLTSNLRERMGLSTATPPLDIPGVAFLPGRKWTSIAARSAEFVATLDRLSREAGATGWLEKSPGHGLYAPIVNRVIPDAWMIHVIRDARDNIGSIWDAAAKYHDPWGMIYDRVERAVDQWNATVDAATCMVGHGRHIFVPYAAIAHAPEAVLDRIADRIGYRGTARGMTAPVGMRGEDEAWKTGAVSGQVAPADSKWDTALSDDEKRRAEALIRPIPPRLVEAMAEFAALAGLETVP